MKHSVATSGLVALAVLAVLGKSAVMLVSVAGMALAYWATRSGPLRSRLLAVAVGGMVSSLVAEIVHTVYHVVVPASSGGDSGGFFVSATLVGAINVLAFGALLLAVEWVARWKGARPMGRSQPSPHPGPDGTA